MDAKEIHAEVRRRMVAQPNATEFEHGWTADATEPDIWQIGDVFRFSPAKMLELCEHARLRSRDRRAGKVGDNTYGGLGKTGEYELLNVMAEAALLWTDRGATNLRDHRISNRGYDCELKDGRKVKLKTSHHWFSSLTFQTHNWTDLMKSNVIVHGVLPGGEFRDNKPGPRTWRMDIEDRMIKLTGWIESAAFREVATWGRPHPKFPKAVYYAEQDVLHDIGTLWGADRIGT